MDGSSGRQGDLALLLKEMEMMMTNWMTTIPGVLTLVMVLWDAWQTKTINWNDLQAALIGIGLVAAKDYSVTGGTRQQ